MLQAPLQHVQHKRKCVIPRRKWKIQVAQKPKKPILAKLAVFILEGLLLSIFAFKVSPLRAHPLIELFLVGLKNTLEMMLLSD